MSDVPRISAPKVIRPSDSPGEAEHESRPRPEHQSERDDPLGVELDSAPRADARVGQVLVDLEACVPDEVASVVEGELARLARARRVRYLGDDALPSLGHVDDGARRRRSDDGLTRLA
jgi:hypothetical protein